MNHHFISGCSTFYNSPNSLTTNTKYVTSIICNFLSILLLSSVFVILEFNCISTIRGIYFHSIFIREVAT
ncbi:hypothetical protein CW304_20165 [Bacillus sp. UFRGS-B20]|nr:hypothetical protein CW304_20165 [Bacillus sp. UFRGS-B20]